MDDICATAKWANRMLRPLTSLHHRLGKYREIQSIDAQQSEVAKKSIAVASSSAHLKRKVDGDNFEEQDSECGDNDPAWIPQNPDARRVKHKYVARGERLRSRPRVRSVLHSPENVKTLPGAIEIATPLITGRSADVTNKGNNETGFGGRQEAQSPNHNTHLTEHERVVERTGRRPKQARFPKPDLQWRVSLDSANDVNYVDIVQRLDVLFLRFLEKTRFADSRFPCSAICSQSLLLTVMRRLPEFIAQEQKLQDEMDGDDDIDMADAYFTEIESAYGSNGKGWQPLREAVRSQGIFLVCDMLQGNWITHLTASILINMCIDAEENDAAERLLSALLLKLDRCDFPDAFDPWRVHQSVRDPIRLLHKYWTVSGNDSFVFREIEALLKRRTLPAEWLVTTPWKPFVASATKSLSSGDKEYAAATRLIAAILEAAADIHTDETYIATLNEQRMKATKRRHVRNSSIIQRTTSQSNPSRCPVYICDALSNLTSSLVVALCSMYCVRVEQPTDLDLGLGTRIVGLFSRMSLALQRDLAMKQGGLRDPKTKVYLLRKGYVLLGHYLLRCQQNTQVSDGAEGAAVDIVLSQDCEYFFELLEKHPDIIKELSRMVGQIVRCCERDGEQAQCRRARRLCTRLLAFEQFGMNNLTLFLGQVAVEVALDFAQYSQDAEDHTFAADIQETVSTRRIRLRDIGGSKTRPENNNTLFFRWEEGIGEWIAKTPLVKAKDTMPRPMADIQTSNSSPYSVREESSCSPSSVAYGSSMTSAASLNSVSLKRKSMDIDSRHVGTKRLRRSFDKTRQSARIAMKQSNVLVVIHTGKHSHSHSDCDSDYDVPACVPESEDWAKDIENETGEISDDDEDAKDTKLQSNVAQQQQGQQKRAEFEVIVHSCGATPSQTPVRRRRGRPRKQVARLAYAQAQARVQAIAARQGPRPGPSQRRSVIPCSEDGEDSDDELSFL